jgi:hypothetical protein
MFAGGITAYQCHWLARETTLYSRAGAFLPLRSEVSPTFKAV